MREGGGLGGGRFAEMKRKEKKEGKLRGRDRRVLVSRLAWGGEARGGTNFFL